MQFALASAKMFQFVTVRSPRQVADNPSGASINPRPGKCSPRRPLRKIATTRAGLRHTLHRPDELLWLLLQLCCLAARWHETRAGIPQSADLHGAMNVRPF
jgi:hypothetical protein